MSTSKSAFRHLGGAISAPFALLMLMSACAPERSSLFADAPEAGARAPEISVLEGDTLVVDGKVIHLAGIETPKPPPAARCTGEAIAARQARLSLKALTDGVKTVAVTPVGAAGVANPLEAQVQLDHVDPAHELIEEGLAVAPTAKRFDWCGPIADALPRASHIAMLSISGT